MRKQNVNEAGNSSTKPFKDFIELFNSFFENKKFENAEVKLMESSKHNYGFTNWLIDNKNFKFGNPEQYNQFFKKELLKEYFDFAGNKTIQEIYFETVASEAEIYKSLFDKKYEASEDKERLLKNEIESYEQLFFPENLRLRTLENPFLNSMDTPIDGLPYCSIDIQNNRDSYQKIIVEGQRDYNADFHNIRLEALVKYYNYLKRFKGGNQIQPKKNKGKKKKNTFKPKRFHELFCKSESLNDCLGLLKEMDKPCVNDMNEFIRNKGVFIIWLTTLESKNMFNYSFKNDIERAQTLNNNFSGLNISESLFRQPNKIAKELYKSHFESEISALKQ